MAGITANKTKFIWDGYAIADLLSISGPSVSVATIDTTAISITQANPTKTYTKGLIDNGDISVDIAWTPSDSDYDALASSVDGSVAAWSITWSDASSTSGNGILTGFTPTGSLDDKVTASLSIKVTGAVTWPT
jgi:predicted secreted protein